MLIFIDESGDAGFKISRGSSPFFVIVLVIFDDELVAEEVALEIKKLKRKLKLHDNYEFKFNKSNEKFKIAFLNVIKPFDFRIRAIVVNKEKVYSQKLRKETKSFYNYFLKCVLEHNNDTILDAKLRLDAIGEKKFKQALQTYLRLELNSQTKKVMNNLKFGNSKNNVLIQLADMVAGSIRRYHEDSKSDSKNYWNIIKKKKEDIWEFK